MKRKKIYINGDFKMCLDVDSLNDLHLYLRQNKKCFYCGCEIKKYGTKKGGDKKIYTKDHFFPRSKGNYLKNNKVLSCHECNSNKGDRNPTQDEIKRYLRPYNGFIYSGGIIMQNSQTANCSGQ